MDEYRWLIYALLAAVAAALTNIFGKIGVKEIDSNLATTLRSFVMVLFLVAVCSVQRLWSRLPTVHAQAMLMIVLSGLAGATSWLFGFKALQVGGEVSQVSPIDKMSVPLAVVLAVIFLRERPGPINWVGVILITLGAYLTALPHRPAM
jgi:transporter family protein